MSTGRVLRRLNEAQEQTCPLRSMMYDLPHQYKMPTKKRPMAENPIRRREPAKVQCQLKLK
ncbi:MAG: hypothetical protein ACETWT_04045 [Thermodesulfobacteriota bacterium]